VFGFVSFSNCSRAERTFRKRELITKKDQSKITKTITKDNSEGEFLISNFFYSFRWIYGWLVGWLVGWYVKVCELRSVIKFVSQFTFLSHLHFISPYYKSHSKNFFLSSFIRWRIKARLTMISLSLEKTLLINKWTSHADPPIRFHARSSLEMDGAFSTQS
jgi:hypothetical protein